MKKDVIANADTFYAYISNELHHVTERAKGQVDQRAKMLAWAWEYAAEASLIAYRNTKQTRFLDLFVRNFDQVLDIRDSELGIRDDLKRRIVNSWGDGILKEGKWINHVTTAGRVSYPASQFIRIVSDDGLKDYQNIANKYLDIIVQIVDEFEEDYQPVPRSNYKYYFRPTTDRLEPINHAHAVGNTFVNLYAITGDSKYKARVEEIARVFMDNVYVESNGSYSWTYFTKEVGLRKNELSEPMWKSQITASFPLHVYNEGILFSEHDIQMIANTLKKNIIVGNEVNTFTSLRNFKAIDANDPPAGVYGIVGWMAFDPIDPEVGDVIVDTITKRPDIFKGGWLANSNISRGYAYLLKYK